jgi:subtilisin-like proprotein convertase family protein
MASLAAMTTLDLEIGPSYLLRLSTDITSGSLGGIVFDMYDAEHYKFAVLSVDTNEVLVGHHTARSGWVIDAAVSYDFGQTADNSLEVTLKGTTVSVVVNGETLLGYAFNALLVDGAYGLLSDGTAVFDQVTVMTDDPAYYVEPTGDEGDTSTGTPVDLVRVYASTEPVTIADRGVTTTSMVIADDYTILDLELQLSISHERMSDLQVFLVASDGTRIELLLDASDATTTFDGSFQLGEIVQGSTMAGTWSLEIHDLNKRMKGSLDNWTLAFTHGEALMAAQPADNIATDTSALTDEQLAAVVDAAISRWIISGFLSEQQVAALYGLQFEIADLSGQLLGISTDSVIYIDQDAAGYGWFVDTTPMADEEFADADGDGLLDGLLDSGAVGKMDLLTVVMHEIGHFLGFDHADEDGYLLMNETLDSGTRITVASSTEDSPGSNVDLSGYADDLQWGSVASQEDLAEESGSGSPETSFDNVSDQVDPGLTADDLRVGTLLQKYQPKIHPNIGPLSSIPD